MKKIVQVAHITEIPGPVQSLAEYIQRRDDFDFYQITHPLAAAGFNISKLLKNGDVVVQKKIKIKGLTKYIANFFTTTKWLKKITGPVDIAIGMNPFDTLPLVFLRKRLKIKKVILFGTDFSRKRFKNPILNFFYVAIDRYCAKKADLVCGNTQRVIRARIEEGAPREKLILTPNGVFMDEIGDVSKKKTYEKKLVYVGHLSAEHGLADVVRLLSGVDLSLDIIGTGPAENSLQNIAIKHEVAGKISFLGKLGHDQVIEHLKNFSGFALAPYNRKSDWSFYCDPVKVKEYLACRVPVVISNVPEICQKIKDENLGFVFDSKEELAKILKIAESMSFEAYARLAENTLRSAGHFDLEKIYDKMFKKMEVGPPRA